MVEQRGTLIPVVGPSGAGKDTLIDQARAARSDIFFPTRVITRRADAGGEVFQEASEAEFEADRAAGAFAFHWGAHGLYYGIPAEIDRVLAEGRHVLFNSSRGVLDRARALYAPLKIVVIMAPRDVLAARLTARGRESAEDVARRLDRAMAMPSGPDVVTVDNGGALADGTAAFLNALPPPLPVHAMEALRP